MSKKNKQNVNTYSNAITDLTTDTSWTVSESRYGVLMPNGKLFLFKHRDGIYPYRKAVAEQLGGKLVTVQGKLTWEAVNEDGD